MLRLFASFLSPSPVAFSTVLLAAFLTVCLTVLSIVPQAVLLAVLLVTFRFVHPVANVANVLESCEFRDGPLGFDRDA
jgi:hypothetical protein